MKFPNFKKSPSKPTFQKGYFLAAVVLFFIEAALALFVQDEFFRPYGGDFLVILFLYCLLKSLFIIPVKNAIFGVLLFAYFLEGLQYVHISELLGLQNNKLFTTVLGNHFEWLDLAIYTLAGIFVLAAERFMLKDH